MSKLSRGIGAMKLLLHAKSPTLWVVGGVAAMGASVIVACRQTAALETVLEPHVEQLEKLKVAQDALTTNSHKVKTRDGNLVSMEDISKDRFSTYIKAGVDCSRLYAVPLVLFIGGACMVFKGHSILQQRNAALAVAFTTLKKSMDAYRARVIAEQGHEADQRFLNGHTEMITGKDGYSQRVATRNWKAPEDVYDRVFSQENSKFWENDLGTNKHFISCQQRYAQQVLNHDGYIYLADVYKGLGLAPSATAQLVGWKIRYLPDGTKDIPIVDFGLDKPLSDDWKYNQEKAVYLAFNCQGLICGGEIQDVLEKIACA